MDHPGVIIRAANLGRLYINERVFFPESVRRGPEGLRILGAENYELTFLLRLCHDCVVVSLKDIAFRLRLSFCLWTASHCSARLQSWQKPTRLEKNRLRLCQEFQFSWFTSNLFFCWASLVLNIPYLSSHVSFLTLANLSSGKK